MTPSVRSLPRCFVPGADPEQPISLPQEEALKFHRVLRLEPGAHVLVMPNDGTAIRCEYRGRVVHPLEAVRPETEPPAKITIAQALPKGDKLDEIIRACTEIGASRFWLFPSDRSVVRWDEDKRQARIRRLDAIAREAAEVAFRTRLPEISFMTDLSSVLACDGHMVVLNESERVSEPLASCKGSDTVLLVGPEGGWSPQESALFECQQVTLGPRVLRVDHAAAAALAVLLID